MMATRALTLASSLAAAAAQGVVFATIDTNTVLGPVSKRALGCHMDSGYAHGTMGVSSQLLFGESFESVMPQGPTWDVAVTGVGSAQLDAAVLFNGAPSMDVNLSSGTFAGVVNRGIGQQGLALEAGLEYDGFAFVLAPFGATLSASLLQWLTNTTIADAGALTVPASSDWQRVNFTLTPSVATTCDTISNGSDPRISCGGNSGFPIGQDVVCVRCGGAFQLGLSSPGTVHVGYVMLQPGAWGRVPGGAPALASAAKTLTDMGVTVIRSGGSFSTSVAWQDWRGAPWARASMQATWGWAGYNDALIGGWGPFEMIDLCNAMGIDCVVTLSAQQTVQQWSDLVEYCYGDESTPWGAVRVLNDSHPEPYIVYAWEIGNEEYNSDFVAQMAAMEARAEALGLTNGSARFASQYITPYYLFPLNSGLSLSDQNAALAAGLNISRIAVDLHMGPGGGVPAAESLFAASPGWPQSAFNGETNTGTHDMLRALTEADDMNTWLSMLPEQSRRIIARTASFCWGAGMQWDQWAQGITTFLPNMTWKQPPGHVHTMIAATWQPVAVASMLMAGGSSPAPPTDMSVSAQTSYDGSSIVVRLMSQAGNATTISFTFAGLHMYDMSSVQQVQLSAPALNASNSAGNPGAIAPVASLIALQANNTLVVPPFSYTVLTFTATVAA